MFSLWTKVWGSKVQTDSGEVCLERSWPGYLGASFQDSQHRVGQLGSCPGSRYSCCPTDDELPGQCGLGLSPRSIFYAHCPLRSLSFECHCPDSIEGVCRIETDSLRGCVSDFPGQTSIIRQFLFYGSGCGRSQRLIGWSVIIMAAIAVSVRAFKFLSVSPNST